MNTIPDQFTTKAVGVTFAPNYPESIYQLSEIHLERMGPRPDCTACLPDDDAILANAVMRSRCRVCRNTGKVGGNSPRFSGFEPGDVEPIAAVLRRNKQNQYDSNAIEIHIPALGQMIGHINKSLAAQLAELIDNGQQFMAGVASVLIMPGKEENPGISLIIRKVDR